MNFKLNRLLLLFFFVYALNEKWTYDSNCNSIIPSEKVSADNYKNQESDPFKFTLINNDESAIENLVRPLEISEQLLNRTKTADRTCFTNIQIKYQTLINSYYRDLTTKNINNLTEDLLYLCYCKLLI